MKVRAPGGRPCRRVQAGHRRSRRTDVTAAGGRSRIRVLPHYGGVTATPTTRYASGPQGALAYQVTGTGPANLLMVPGMHSHLELQWQLPGYRRFVRGLTRPFAVDQMSAGQGG